MGGMVQMTWQPSLVKLVKRSQGSPPLGLRNLGNTCYLNSVLQCLTYTPPLAGFCLRFLHSSICDLGTGKEKKGECPFCILEKRIVRSLSSEAVSDAPLKINSCLRIYAEHFRAGRQEDAHEFLRYVIDACHDTCLRLKKLHRREKGENGFANGGDVGGTVETVVNEIFGGALRSQVKCLSCGAESNKVDEIMDISLEILHSGSLKEALQKFFQPEVLDGNNKYKCDSCKVLAAARKQMSILQAPNVLVIQLKRFEGMYGGKIDKAIAFDEILLLSSYMCKPSQDLHPEYSLFGTIVHSGFSPDSGHYYAYVKDAYGRWYCCNDSYVSVSNLEEVLSEKVYILFFSRTKQRPEARVDTVAYGSKLNGSKTSIFQKSGCLEEPVCSGKFSNNHSEANNIKSQESNGTRTLIHKSDSVDDTVNTKISSDHSLANNSTAHLTSNGTKTNGTAVVDRSDRGEPSVSVKEISDKYPQNNVSVPSLCSNGSNSNGIQKSGALVELVNVNGTSSHHCQTSNSSKTKVELRFPSQQKNTIFPGSTKKPLGNGNIKISVYKRESREANGSSTVSVTSEEKENIGLPVNGRNGVSKIPYSQGLMNGHNGHISPEVNGTKSTIASQKSLNSQNLQNGDPKSSSNNSGMKRKPADNHPCVLLARDAQSRAEVEAFKELIGKEASMFLRSCGWSDEVHSAMHAQKKLCQDARENALSDHEKKSLLVSHAKRNFTSKVPEALKARLVEHIKEFSQEKSII